MEVKPLIANYYPCPVCGLRLVWDTDGSASGLGEPCWWCPPPLGCQYIDADHEFPAPK